MTYGAVFLILGIELPYLSAWLNGRGFSSIEIGLIIGTPLWLRIILGPMIGIAADRYAANRLLVVALASAAAIGAFWLAHTDQITLVLILVALVLVASQSTLPLVDTLAIETSHRDRTDYGRMRLWGSISFIVANLAGGWAIGWIGSEVVVWMIGAAAAIAAATALRLPNREQRASGTGTTRAKLDGNVVRVLLSDRRFQLLIVAAGTVQASHAVYYAFSVLAWHQHGWSSELIGLLWGLGVAAEIILFSMSGRLIALIGANRMLAIGAIGGLVRWLGMAAEPGLATTVALQSMHALSFGATYLATVHVIHAIAPTGRGASAQALNSAIGSGLAMAIALIAAGAIFRAYGTAAYLAMAALAAVGLIAALLLLRQERVAQPS